MLTQKFWDDLNSVWGLSQNRVHEIGQDHFYGDDRDEQLSHKAIVIPNFYHRIDRYTYQSMADDAKHLNTCGVMEVGNLYLMPNQIAKARLLAQMLRGLFYRKGRLLYYCPDNPLMDELLTQYGFIKRSGEFFNPNSGNTLVEFYIDLPPLQGQKEEEDLGEEDDDDYADEDDPF